MSSMMREASKKEIKVLAMLGGCLGSTLRVLNRISLQRNSISSRPKYDAIIFINLPHIFI